MELKLLAIELWHEHEQKQKQVSGQEIDVWDKVLLIEPKSLVSWKKYCIPLKNIKEVLEKEWYELVISK